MPRSRRLDVANLDRSEVRSRLRTLSEKPDLSDDEGHEIDDLLVRLSDLDRDDRRSRASYAGGGRGGDVRSQALQIVEDEGRHLSSHQQDHMDRLLRSRTRELDGAQIAERMVLTENDSYRSAFSKAMVDGSPVFTDEERRALLRFAEFRAATEGTPSAGGYGVPVLIDPTIVLTSGAGDAPIINISRMVTITTDAWKGVTSQGVSWSYDAEASAVSDDTPTFAQPVIPVYMARGFIPYSIELGQDYPGFADEMSMLLNQGYLDLQAQKTANGSGSSEPLGIFPAMANITTNPAHVMVTTAGTIGGVDLRAAWAALPERYRPRATWVMSPTFEAKIRALGNNLSIADFTVNLTADGIPVLTGRPVVTTDYAPAFTGTTGAANYAVVGDFSRFLFVQRAGMSVELVPTLFDQATGRPSGQRGWLAMARQGHSVVDPNAFRLLANS